MKKISKTKLALSTEVVRSLSNNELGLVNGGIKAGGGPQPSNNNCNVVGTVDSVLCTQDLSSNCYGA